MTMLTTDEPLAVAVVEAIHVGDVDRLRQLVQDHPELANARIGTDRADDDSGCGGETRTLLHVVTDWPGHFPNGAATVAVLVEAGADVDARFTGPHAETPLHWAASSDDVEVLDALLDAGADIEAPGSVLSGGPPLTDAVAFGQWKAARRLVERGANTTLWQAAALGLMERVDERFEADPPPTSDDINLAFWSACHGGQLRVANYLLERGAELDWLPDWEPCTPLDAARRSEAYDVLSWLEARGAHPAEWLEPS